jgi:hypothetical protein
MVVHLGTPGYSKARRMKSYRSALFVDGESPSMKLEVHLWQRHVEVRADNSEEPVQLSITKSSDFTLLLTQYISPRARRQAYLPPSLEERRLEPSMELPEPRATTRDGAASFGALGDGFFTAFLTFCATPLVVGFCLDSSMTSSSCCAESDLAGASLAFVSWSCSQFGYVETRVGSTLQACRITDQLVLIPLRDIRRAVRQF